MVDKKTSAKRSKAAPATDGLPDSGGAADAGIPAQIELRGIETLVPYARNSRTHSDAQVAELAASIDEFGLVGGIVVRDGVIAKGHGTLQGCIKLLKAGKSLYPAPGRAGGARPYPDGQIPIIDASGWTDAQFRAFVIADNRLALNADWNYEMLAVEIDDLRDMDFDLNLLGFDQQELNDMIGTAATGPEAVEGEDDAPEPPENPVTNAGDVWLLGGHRVMCGDSTDAGSVALLMAGEKADMVFTSPPYNANTKAGDGDIFTSKKPKKLYADGYSDNLPSSEYVAFAKKVLAICFDFTDGFIFWNVSYNANSRYEYIQQIADRLPFLIEQICWKKSSTIPFKGSMMRDWEPVYLFSTNGKTLGLDEVVSNHWAISNTNSQADDHKACFPVALPEKGIGLVRAHSGVVFEPFGGSGTTLIACEKMGRRARLMELDPKYCDVIVRRWQGFTGQQATLEGDGRTFEQIADERIGATA